MKQKPMSPVRAARCDSAAGFWRMFQRCAPGLLLFVFSRCDELEELDLLELMLAEDAAGIFSGGTASERSSGPASRGWEFFFGNSFVGCRLWSSTSEVGVSQKSVLILKKISANFGNWPAPVSEAVFTRKGGRISYRFGAVDIEKKFARARSSGSRLVNRKRARDFRGAARSRSARSPISSAVWWEINLGGGPTATSLLSAAVAPTALTSAEYSDGRRFAWVASRSAMARRIA